MTNELLDRIEDWLSVKVKTDITVMSPVNDADMYELAEIVDELIAAKYGEYIDTGYPIDVRFANLQTHEKNMFAAPPRLKQYSTLDDITLAMGSAMMNLSLAQGGVRNVGNQLTYYTLHNKGK